MIVHLGHSSVRTTADIYSHAIRGKDHAAALSWDTIMQRARGEESKGVNRTGGSGREGLRVGERIEPVPIGPGWEIAARSMALRMDSKSAAVM